MMCNSYSVVYKYIELLTIYNRVYGIDIDECVTKRKQKLKIEEYKHYLAHLKINDLLV